jgi:hypothetical protein
MHGSVAVILPATREQEDGGSPRFRLGFGSGPRRVLTQGSNEMQQLTPEGRRIVEEIARRYAVSADAVLTLLQAVSAGNGTMAQFSHPELGGMGQWCQGGMIMVGDMFNNALKAKVDGLCTELSELLRRQPAFAGPGSTQSQSQYTQTQSQGGGFGGAAGPGEVSLFVPAAGGGSGNWWGADFGSPSSSGAQNNIRYAFFPAARRLAIGIDGRVTVYDTLDHQIGGVSQQQGGDASLSFTSQYGLVRLADLPVVSGDRGAEPPPATPSQMPASAPLPAGDPGEEVFAKIEKLAALHQKGILSDQEFSEKKAELLSRL